MIDQFPTVKSITISEILETRTEAAFYICTESEAEDLLKLVTKTGDPGPAQNTSIPKRHVSALKVTRITTALDMTMTWTWT
jgi:hypothetical protein